MRHGFCAVRILVEGIRRADGEDVCARHCRQGECTSGLTERMPGAVCVRILEIPLALPAFSVLASPAIRGATCHREGQGLLQVREGEEEQGSPDPRAEACVCQDAVEGAMLLERRSRESVVRDMSALHNISSEVVFVPHATASQHTHFQKAGTRQLHFKNAPKT